MDVSTTKTIAKLLHNLVAEQRCSRRGEVAVIHSGRGYRRLGLGIGINSLCIFAWVVQQQIRRSMLWAWRWRFVILCIITRLALMPFTFHWWEAQTWVNVGYDLHNGVNPYTHFVQMSNLKLGSYYEYWAYLPLWMMFLYPFYLLIAPFNTPLMPLGQQSTTLPFLVSFVLKLPIFFLDILCGLLIYKIVLLLGDKTRAKKGVYLWLANPLIVFVSAIWGHFEPLPISLTLMALYFFLVDKPSLSAISLGLGVTAKLYPAYLLPIYAIYLLKEKGWKSCIKYCVIFILTVAAICVPFIFLDFSAMLAVANFHGSRLGGGITIWSILWYLVNVTHVAVKTLTMIQNLSWIVTGIVFGYLGYIMLRMKSMTKTNLVIFNILSLLGFYLGNKLVNEPYTTWVVPFMVIYLCIRSRSWWYKLYSLIPLIFIGLNGGYWWFINSEILNLVIPFIRLLILRFQLVFPFALPIIPLEMLLQLRYIFLFLVGCCFYILCLHLFIRFLNERE